MNRVYIALGSNIDSERNVRAAVRQLAARFRLLAVSPIYETAPVGKTDQAKATFERMAFLYPDTYWANWAKARLKG